MADMEEKEIYEVMGYLSNPLVDMRYDVQVPSLKQAEFESEYKQLTGSPPCSPGSGGYSVLGAGVDKRAAQYRFSYVPSGSVPSVLQSMSKGMSGAAHRKRVSNKVLLLEMFKKGFKLGNISSQSDIISRFPETSFSAHFAFGYTRAGRTQASLERDEFSQGFSAVYNDTQRAFCLFDKQSANLVHSMRVGRSAAFRHRVLKAYSHQCCVCAGSLLDLSGVYETEAAHIAPKSLGGSDDIRNGLALCRKHHWSFDRGMFGINARYYVVVPKKVASIKENNSLKKHDKQPISLPSNSDVQPHASALKWHTHNILLPDN